MYLCGYTLHNSSIICCFCNMWNWKKKVEVWQLLPVRGIVNARDLGGYSIGEDKHVRKGMLIRSAHLAEATNADLAFLEGMKIAKVVDFRTEHEKQGVEDKVINGSEYIALPLDASGSEAAKASDEERSIFARRKRFDMKKVIMMAAFNDRAKAIAQNLYPTILTYPICMRQMAAFLRFVVDAGDVPILFHCTQGKDRTGIASALLLAALGADRETIVADFDVTNQIYEKDVRKFTRRVRLFGGRAEEVAVVKSFIGANTENFVKTLDMIDQEYGSLEGYLSGPMGLSEDDLRILKERYLIKDVPV